MSEAAALSAPLPGASAAPVAAESLEAASAGGLLAPPAEPVAGPGTERPVPKRSDRVRKPRRKSQNGLAGADEPPSDSLPGSDEPHVGSLATLSAEVASQSNVSAEEGHVALTSPPESVELAIGSERLASTEGAARPSARRRRRR